MTRKQRRNGTKKPVRTADGYNNLTSKTGGIYRQYSDGGHVSARLYLPQPDAN